jgi:hypothetical protein
MNNFGDRFLPNARKANSVSNTDDETPPTTNQIQAASTVSKQHIKSALPEITLSTVRSLIDKPLFCQLTSSTASTFHDEKQNSATPDSPNQNSNLLSECAAGTTSEGEKEVDEEGEENIEAVAVFETSASKLPLGSESDDPVVPLTTDDDESRSSDDVVPTSTAATGSSIDQ